jgi:hypothetical protein
MPRTVKITKQIVQLERNCKSSETASANVVSVRFANSRIGADYSPHVMIAEFQADAVMLGRSMNRQSLMAMTSDAYILCLSAYGCIPYV